jgi:haloalkane dehalogenase
MATEKGLPPAVRDGYLAPYGSWADRVGILRFVQDIPMSPRHPSWPTLTAIEEALPRFRDRPALLVWGERDWCFTPAFREEWQRRLPQAEVHRLPEAGHYVMEDAREEAVSLIAGFAPRP